MKLMSLIFTMALFISSTAFADVLQGGSRQQYDKMSCTAYQPVWHDYDVTLTGGTVQFGPEAQVPGWLSSNSALPPAEQAAADAFSALAVLQTAYVGGSSLSSWIGYDEYKAAFDIAYSVVPHGTGPSLAAPWPPNYPGLSTDPEVMRTYKVDQTVAAISHTQSHTLQQLSDIRTKLLETPTCGGVRY